MAILDPIWRLVSHDLAIDLGTANTLVAVRGKGIMVREPTMVVRHKKTKQIMAIGQQAKQVLGKTPANLEVIRPLRNGVIADFDAAEAILRDYISQVHTGRSVLPLSPHPRVIVGIPSRVTEVQRRAVQEAGLAAGASKVWLIEEPMAAAIGSGMAVEEPSGVLVMDIGGGTTEIAAFSMSGIVVKRSVTLAGDEMDERIINYLRNQEELLIGEATAEQVKFQLASFAPVKSRSGKSPKMVVRGRDLSSGLPKSTVVTQKQIQQAVLPVIRQILAELSDVIAEIPPELVADIMEQGVILTGGGALIPGLDALVADQTQMPVWVADDPLTCVVRGCLALYEKPDLLDKVRLVAGLKS